MKVSEIKYRRVSFEEISGAMESATKKVRAAKTAEDVLKARDEYVSAVTEFSTFSALAYMRYTINTVDQFYSSEKD